jgi:hypothetical protein
MTWVLEKRPDEPILPIVQVIILQDAWRRLTSKSRAALVAVVENPFAAVHPATVKALRSHGLLDEHGCITEAGTAVVRHRPDMSGEQQ